MACGNSSPLTQEDINENNVLLTGTISDHMKRLQSQRALLLSKAHRSPVLMTQQQRQLQKLHLLACR